MLPTETAGVAGAPVEGGELRGRLLVVARRWRLVTLVTVGSVVGVYVLATLRTDQYRATSDLRIATGTPSSISTTTAALGGGASAHALDEEVQELGSAAVEAAVAKAYSGPLDPEHVHAAVAPGQVDTLRVSLVGPHPTEVAALVNLYVAAFVDVRRTAEIADLLAREHDLQSRIAALNAQVQGVRAPLDALDVRVAAAPSDAGLVAERDALARQLAPQLTPLDSQRADDQNQIQELDRAIQLTYSSGFEVVRSAVTPTTPVSPEPVRDAAVAFVVGLLVAAGLALAVDAYEQRGLAGADLVGMAGGKPVLARIPFVAAELTEDRVAVRDNPAGLLAQAYRALAATIDEQIEGTHRVVQVTSSGAGEGKTTAVANLAEALAERGHRVAVVCGDLRRPRLEACLGVALSPGLSEVLLGQAALVDVVQRTASGVLVVSAGEQPPDPAELLATERPVAVVAELARRADVVLVDCPPVLPVTDALLLTRVADATVVVADARTTERKALAESLELLRQVGAPVAGLVLNSVGVDDPQTERGARRPSARRPTDPTDDIRPSVAAS